MKGKNTIMKERISINCAVSEIVFQSLHSDTDTPSYTRSVSLQFEKNRYVERFIVESVQRDTSQLEDIRDCTCECPRSQAGLYPHHKRPESLLQFEGE